VIEFQLLNETIRVKPWSSLILLQNDCVWQLL
jgi:hypothetical protein